MNIVLKDFQEDAVRILLKYVRNAKREVVDGDAQAIILSSPTGSGKTAIVTELIESILQGDDGQEPDPAAVFLWLSDSPELNQQSRDKMLAQSSFLSERDLIVVEPPFSQEYLDPAKVYFLNIQKLAKDSLLTKAGDLQPHTIWQTIENTSKANPQHFFLIIDEAHRGMNLTAREVRQAETIVQKFIIGDANVGLSPVKIVLGMSATPERFARIIEGSPRIKREHVVPHGAARASGLLKDSIVLFCPEQEQTGDWTFLSEAIRRWDRFRSQWREYCHAQGVPIVDPVFVIQVEDGTEGRLTRTDLSQAVDVLEREVGRLDNESLVHCFEIEGPVDITGRQIRKVEPSKIQQDSKARFVFFKMALNTGWDCPRAEVMMSFRRAKDYTSIAQLVGRMIRTPLARRVEGSDLLNTVALYLPHYDRTGLHAIVDKLNDPEIATPTEVIEGSRLVTLKQNPAHEELLAVLSTLPTYSVERVQKASNVRRLVKLARLLTIDEVDPDIWNKTKSMVVEALNTELERLKKNSRFTRSYKENEVVEIREVQIEAGDWKEVGEGRVTRVKATPETINELFDTCGRMLGEGLHKEYWKSKWDRSHPQRAKLELYAILQERSVWQKLETMAGKHIEELFDENRESISELSTSKREEYNRIRRRSKEPQAIFIVFPDEIEVSREMPEWEHHLYVTANGLFGWHANTWEEAVLREEMGQQGFVAWLRNFPRKHWSICVPYVYRGEDRPLYPDLLVFRRTSDKLHVDLLDPHNSGLPDAVEKAVGLARFAEKHGDQYGRIELISLGSQGDIRRLNVNREVVREKVKRVGTAAHLDALFEAHV